MDRVNTGEQTDCRGETWAQLPFQTQEAIERFLTEHVREMGALLFANTQLWRPLIDLFRQPISREPRSQRFIDHAYMRGFGVRPARHGDYITWVNTLQDTVKEASEWLKAHDSDG